MFSIKAQMALRQPVYVFDKDPNGTQAAGRAVQTGLGAFPHPDGLPLEKMLHESHAQEM